MASKAEAKDTVLVIAKRYGFIADDIMNKIESWDPDIRRTIEESMLAKDEMAAHSIKTLAKQIYGSDARFVFELLQNADDNRFTRASASGALPFVSFKVHPNRIIVECNEDGFTKSDLWAICSVGQSTKSASHGYIGAKGIGFKSVFIAAWKVYIQSGHFSFYFKHEKDDSGLGMVLPVWKDSDEDVPSPLTRMTLYLHRKGELDELEHLRQTIFKQLYDLQETCLLFLRKLKKISVDFYNADGELESSKSFCIGGVHDHKVFLETALTDTHGETTMQKRHFHVTKDVATNLSKSDSRELPDTEEARAASSVAEVILAFPLTSDSKPRIDKHEIFAFLPVRGSEFKFLIQSDFDTSASRQDISTTSRRNIDLLDAIAKTFIKAVLQFCEHEDLCYTWPSFLPPPSDGSNAFWSGLNHGVKRLVSETPILKSRHGGKLRKINDVVKLASDFQDDNGSPLLDDSALDPFLSKGYLKDSYNTLKQYGLRVMTAELLLDLLYADLKSPTSSIKSRSMSEEWHSAVAQVVLRCTAKTHHLFILKDLALLPLRSGQWVSINSGPVYLPTTKGVPIPSGVDIRILDPAAVANKNWKELYIQLGAAEPSVADVRALILTSYRSFSSHVGMAESRAHLHYLYSTHQTKQAPDELNNMYIYRSDGIVGKPHQDDFYLPSDHPYGPQALLEPAGSAPGHPVAFVHSTYLQNVPSPTSSTHPSWKSWLHDFVGVRERLRLVSRDGRFLSDTWTYVAKYRPEKLLGMLEYLWHYQGLDLRDNDNLKLEIKNTEANKLCGHELSRRCNLDGTYLPLPHLQEQCSRFMELPEHFPFLDLDAATSSAQLSIKWTFLHTDFSVGMDDDASFLLDILSWIKSAHHSASTIHRFQRLLDLYFAIDAKCLGAADHRAKRKQITRVFKHSHYVFVPAKAEHEAKWASPDDCLWDAPPDMMSMHSLKDLYAPAVSDDQMELLSRFFRKTLTIPQASWINLTFELQQLRDSNCDDFDRILSLYKYLNSMTINVPSDELKRKFVFEDLIFMVRDGQPGWYKSIECLWSSTTEIRGKVTLNSHYEDLKDFFVDILGVQTLTVQMVYDELLQTDPQMTINEVKSTIWSFNALLQAEPPDFIDPKPLLKVRVFPVTYPNGSKALRSTDTEFAIADRDYLAMQFKDRIKLLDYSLAEIRHLKPFFEWANLTHLYLSTSVKEFTSVAEGATRSISNPNRDLKPKAHALLRYKYLTLVLGVYCTDQSIQSRVAATFNSPRYRVDAARLYQLLRTARVIETNCISSVLSISQDGHRAEVKSTIGDMHISEGNSELAIYVPMNKEKQDFCFASPLPTNLEDWLMRDSRTQIRDKADGDMVTVLTTLLTVDLSVVKLILDHKGIIQVPLPTGDMEVVETVERTFDPVADDAASSRPPMTPSSSTSEHLAGAIGTPGTPPTETRYEAFSEQVIARQSQFAYRQPVPAPSRSASVLSNHPHPTAEDMQYRMLLSKVVEAARRAKFPSRGAFDMTSLFHALPGEDSHYGVNAGDRFRSSTQLERDKKIGAAGELYVFELLTRLDPALPGWSRENWQSTIREYATVHPDYVDMEAWSGRETADMIYEDKEGHLTALLVDSGHLDHDEWHNARPRYYIEVKTTTGPCGTPFYMSKFQYQRMRDVHNADDQAEVYMILRVFEIEGARISMTAYLDPERLKLDERLVFTGETWSVVPTQRRQI